MRSLVSIALVQLVCIAALWGQLEPAVVPDQPSAGLNYLGKYDVIHANLPDQANNRYEWVTLQAIVRRNGTVESATATRGPKELFAQAQEIELRRRFKPFEKDGRPVRASIEDTVQIVPLEQWGTKQPFPRVSNWDSLRFTLNRPPWYCEDCPAYSVEVWGDGRVLFHGIHPAVIAGDYQGAISHDQVSALLNSFRQADYFSLRDKYVLSAFDLDTVKTSMTVDGQTKKVVDYGGLEVGMPEAVHAVEGAMDEAVITTFRSMGLSQQAELLQTALNRRHY